MGSLIAAACAFVGTHFLLSHPLRAPLVRRIGGAAFLGLYSLVALLTLGWMAHAYARVPDQVMAWQPGDLLWGIASAVMLLASVLFAGSLRGNPALPRADGQAPATRAPQGVYALTRHPMMWAFALWALVHAAVLPQAANWVLTAAILILALGGAAAQDAKKRRLQPDFWPEWQRRTSFVPFAALLSGHLPATAALPGPATLAGGTALWLAVTWVHIPLAGWPAGIWRWIG